MKYVSEKNYNVSSRYFVSLLFTFSAIFVFVGCDVGTKTTVNTHLNLNDTIEVIPNFFSITHIKNPGVAFGMFANSENILRYFFVFFVPFVVIIFLVYNLKNIKNKMERLSYILIISGAIGNLVDRISNGHVTDFLDFHFKTFYWPVFNLADVFIVLGVGFLLLINLRTNSNRSKLMNT